ncbi:hypothetical protein ES288_A11G230400v1 [Gossypium darwinii]|uniref:Uncharacterized protein n=1 Tax=Gossypium darwinii TaxID=34276 RepID=A0A5D2EN95_GOSDA|nr:hypothetical protein ES288_A11G230400v1 [Gossypium darwinii]
MRGHSSDILSQAVVEGNSVSDEVGNILRKLENHPSGRHSSKMGKKKSLKISTNLTKGEGSKFKSRAKNRIPIAKAVNLVVNRLDDGVSKEELGSKNEDNFTVKNVSNLDV